MSRLEETKKKCDALVAEGRELELKKNKIDSYYKQKRKQAKLTASKSRNEITAIYNDTINNLAKSRGDEMKSVDQQLTDTTKRRRLAKQGLLEAQAEHREAQRLAAAQVA